MRRVIGYVDGRAIWEDLGPSEARSGHIGGHAIEPAQQMPSKGAGSLDALRIEARRARTGLR